MTCSPVEKRFQSKYLPFHMEEPLPTLERLSYVPYPENGHNNMKHIFPKLDNFKIEKDKLLTGGKIEVYEVSYRHPASIYKKYGAIGYIWGTSGYWAISFTEAGIENPKRRFRSPVEAYKVMVSIYKVMSIMATSSRPGESMLAIFSTFEEILRETKKK